MTRTLAGRLPPLGQNLRNLETPTLFFRNEILRRNLRSFARRADDNDVALRPHVKAHRIPEITRWQTDESNSGIMCQKLSLAEVMVRNGIDDVVVVCPIVSEQKLRRLAWLSRAATTFAVVVDGTDNLDVLEHGMERFDGSVEVIVEADIGGGRTGMAPDGPIEALVERIQTATTLEFGGLLAYDNHVLYESTTRSEFVEEADRVIETLERIADRVAAVTGDTPTVRTGTTGTSGYMAQSDVVSEINPGRYLVNDTSLVEFVDEVRLTDCAARVLSTVVSRPDSDTAVVDVGAKTVSWMRHHLPECVDDPDVTFVDIASEHGVLDVGATDSPPSVGDTVEFVVGNIDGAINLQDHVVGIENDTVSHVWNVPTCGQTR